MVMEKEDIAILHKAGSHIRQVEISNPNGRVYPRTPDEADYASFFRALKRGGFRGWYQHSRPPGCLLCRRSPRHSTVTAVSR